MMEPLSSLFSPLSSPSPENLVSQGQLGDDSQHVEINSRSNQKKISLNKLPPPSTRNLARDPSRARVWNAISTVSRPAGEGSLRRIEPISARRLRNPLARDDDDDDDDGDHDENESHAMRGHDDEARREKGRRRADEAGSEERPPTRRRSRER